MEMRKLFLLGLMSCALFGSRCIAMESEDQRAVEVEVFEDLPLAEEIERRRTKELVDGLGPDLWGEVAGFCSDPKTSVCLLLVNSQVHVGARRSWPVWIVKFPHSPYGDFKRFIDLWVGLLDLAGEDEEWEDPVSDTPAWNDHAMWNRHPGMFECLKKPAGWQDKAGPNHVRLFVMLAYRFDGSPGASNLYLEKFARKLGGRILGLRGDCGSYLRLVPNLKKLQLSNFSRETSDRRNLKHVPELTELLLTNKAHHLDLFDSDLEHLIELEKIDLDRTDGISGECLLEMPRVKELKVCRLGCSSDFKFSFLERLPFLVVLNVSLADELTDYHLDRLRLKKLELDNCPGVTGSCFESEILSDSLCESLCLLGCTGIDAQHLSSLKKLSRLRLCGRSGGSDYRFLREMPELKTLNTEFMDLVDEDLDGLPLCELFLHSCKNVDGSCFSQMPNLRSVRLCDCRGINEDLIGEEFDKEDRHVVENCYRWDREIVLKRKKRLSEDQ